MMSKRSNQPTKNNNRKEEKTVERQEKDRKPQNQEKV
jgi:hypothetical protein